MPGYTRVKAVLDEKLTSQLGKVHSATWISRIHRSGVSIVDIGIDITRNTRSLII
jgi:hypothetical protein